MKEEKEVNYWNIGIVVLVFVGTIGLGAYCYWKGKNINEADGYNSIDSSIALSALLVNVITIIFVYGTFKTQKQQIDDNRRDVEFNRLVDIVYRQLEQFRENLKITEEQLKEIDTENKESLNFSVSSLKFSKSIAVIKNENLFYSKLLEKSYLDNVDKEYIFKLYTSNIGYEYKSVIRWSLEIINQENFEENYLQDLNLTANMGNNSIEGNKIKVLKLKILVTNLKEIDKIFHQYNVSMEE